GIAKVAIKENPDGSRYLAIYYAGPMRSAGGTDQALTLVIGDFVRRLLGLDCYKPTEEEVNRFVEEMRLYERSVGRFQYHVPDEQLRKALRTLPVEVTGTESDPIEVQSFRNLPRIETNCVRGGALRVVNDGVIGRARKVHTIVEKLGIEGWDWLRGLGKTEAARESRNADFMEDVIAGRPVFSFPSQKNGFRLRYGRARNTGLAAIGVHPVTMMVLDRFLAGGTQIRVELPGKGGVVMPVDAIETPIVSLKNGSVLRISEQNFKTLEREISQILFPGDLLISFGDFFYNNQRLLPSGYTEEWWCAELRSAMESLAKDKVCEVAEATKVSANQLKTFAARPFHQKPNAREAVALAKHLGIPLHPRYNFFWSNVNAEEVQKLRDWVLNSQLQRDGGQISAIAGRLDPSVAEILRKLCLPHRVEANQALVEDDDAFVLTTCLSIDSKAVKIDTNLPTLDALKTLSGIEIRAKAPTTVGARMGRPEKAKRREMNPLVHILFPVGLAGGKERNLITASKKGVIHVDLVRRECPNCHKTTLRTKCNPCGIRTVVASVCPRCGRKLEVDVCPSCKAPVQGFQRRNHNLEFMLTEACSQLESRRPRVIKGVKGLSNKDRVPEIIHKGILRAREDLSVYKDGTIRFDATNAPLTHFKPVEIETPLLKLRELGYTTDLHGKSLTDPEQICELRVQDVVIPKKGAAYFVRVSRFVDDLLEKVYKLPRHYDAERPADLVGHLAIGLAPHTSVGILGRIIGFTDLSVCYAHPLWHSAKRRDCDGDEDALILALDTLLNFSRAFLPSQIGGIMDAPLFIIPRVNPVEVQRQAHEFDIAERYPQGFYEETLVRSTPGKVAHMIEMVAQKLGTAEQFEGYGYTTPVSNINSGNQKSVYKRLAKMTAKLNGQMALAEKIAAVDAKQVALKVLTTHFMRDISGNLRAFSTQRFRCKTCGKRFRRIPLKGRCLKCEGALSLTVYRGGIVKYVEAARTIIRKYKLPGYYLDYIALVEKEVMTLFEGKGPRQIRLESFS
ncbi:MAG: DNA polymerase II large subunit, partial [Candidatus Bathyarchaeota archaeon]|nr:DNA polymerase II large subunit [Candidatus Bathyarchaeota archaeon]